MQKNISFLILKVTFIIYTTDCIELSALMLQDIYKKFGGPEFGAMSSITGLPVTNKVELTDDTGGIVASPLSWSPLLLSIPILVKIATNHHSFSLGLCKVKQE